MSKLKADGLIRQNSGGQYKWYIYPDGKNWRIEDMGFKEDHRDCIREIKEVEEECGLNVENIEIRETN